MKKPVLLLIATVLLFAAAVPALGADKAAVDVTFTLQAPAAKEVYLSGSFNNWNPAGEKMTKDENGVWSVTIKLKPDTYQYKFVADGIWITDLNAASFVDDGFGGRNSVIVVKAPGASDNARIDQLELEVATLNASQGGFQINGYARAGFVMDKDGRQVQGSSQVDGAWSKYRLGNEADTFIENTLSKKWEMDDGSWAKATFLWAHSDNCTGNVWEEGAALRQSFVEMGNLSALNNDLTFWAGRRYYRRSDIHLTDFYWKDFSGIGAGVQGFKLGNATLDVALMYHGDTSGLALQQLILTLTGIKIGPGSLEVDLAPTFQQDDNIGDSGAAIAVGTQYNLGDFFGLTKGSSYIGLYYGNSIASNPNWYGPAGEISSVEENTHLRVLATGVSQINDNLEIQPLLLYQSEEKTDNSTATWASVGCRPVYYFNKNFALQFEVGYDTTDQNDQKDSGVSLAIAPTITLDLGYYTRPQLRAFVSTFIPEEGDSTVKYGVQCETWW